MNHNCNNFLQGAEEKSGEKSGSGDKEEGGESFGDKVKHVGDAIKDEFNKDVDKLAEVTHMKPWWVVKTGMLTRATQIGFVISNVSEDNDHRTPKVNKIRLSTQAHCST